MHDEHVKDLREMPFYLIPLAFTDLIHRYNKPFPDRLSFVQLAGARTEVEHAPDHGRGGARGPG
jgi:hypothetical protein